MRSICDCEIDTSLANAIFGAPIIPATAGINAAHARIHVFAITHLDRLAGCLRGVAFEPELDLKPSCDHPEAPFQVRFSIAVLSLGQKNSLELCAIRILIVEDDPEIARRLADGLAASGFAIERADNGVDGYDMGKDEDYDAIVLDLGLPQMPGIEVLRNWRSAGVKTPVLVLTARGA